MNILVTGGAGYVGSHTAKLLHESGHDVWIYDNLSKGHRQAALTNKLVEGDLHDGDLLRRVMQNQKIEAVMHFAAFSLVGESVVNPAKYYRNNLMATLSLLDAMRDCDVPRIVFSSTAATYGEPTTMPISEDTPQKPVNPYGFTKLAMEQALTDYAHAYGLGFAALRYFNAAGAAVDGSLGEDHTPETHLIPIVLQVALGQRDHITIFGDDYPTEDGTCVRDYIHVDDLATAHLAALQKIGLGQGLKLNLGTGRGNSVREVIEACRLVTGRNIPEVAGERRPGDPPELVADPQRAMQVLNWQPQYTDLNRLVETAWQWHKTHPNGYGESRS